METREGMPTGESIQIIEHGSENFMITPNMLYIDEEVRQNPLKDIETLDSALPKILTKAL
jgi:hypothetical protein